MCESVPSPFRSPLCGRALGTRAPIRVEGDDCTQSSRTMTRHRASRPATQGSLEDSQRPGLPAGSPAGRARRVWDVRDRDADRPPRRREYQFRRGLARKAGLRTPAQPRDARSRLACANQCRAPSEAGWRSRTGAMSFPKPARGLLLPHPPNNKAAAGSPPRPCFMVASGCRGGAAQQPPASQTWKKASMSPPSTPPSWLTSEQPAEASHSEKKVSMSPPSTPPSWL
ncbi:MAG: hypothetical protein RL689_27 [Planctomycetota bacterium]